MDAADGRETLAGPDLYIEGAIKEWLRRWCGYVREAPSRSSEWYLE